MLNNNMLSVESYLVKLQNIQQIKQLSVLLIVLQLHIILLQTMQCEFCFVVNVNFHGLRTGNTTHRLPQRHTNPPKLNKNI